MGWIESSRARTAGLECLLAQELPVQPAHDVENQLIQLRDHALKVISESEGLKVTDIANLLGVSGSLGDTGENRRAAARYPRPARK